MKKIFIPTEKRNATSRGYWKNPDGKLYRDFLRFEIAEAVTVKRLKELCKEYRQEAIFYVSINNRTKKHNSATCFYASGKIEKFNRCIKRFCDTRQDLKDGIKSFLKRGYTCYTIEKITSGFYLYTWIKRPDKKKRIAKRNKLIKKLILKCKNVSGYNFDIPLKIRIAKSQKGNFNRLYMDWQYNPLYNIVTINPDTIKYNRIHAGFTVDGYYKGRHEKINRYVLNNYKSALRFVILHEIGHAFFNCKYRNYKGISNIPLKRKELYADNFAKRYIKKV